MPGREYSNGNVVISSYSTSGNVIIYQQDSAACSLILSDIIVNATTNSNDGKNLVGNTTSGYSGLLTFQVGTPRANIRALYIDISGNLRITNYGNTAIYDQFDTNGQLIVDAPNGYIGNLLNLRLNGTSELSVNQAGSVTFNAHLANTGTTSTVAGGAQLGTGGTVAIDGNSTDFAGQVNITSGTGTTGGQMLHLTFVNAYATTPYIQLSWNSGNAATFLYVWAKTTTDFYIGMGGASPSTAYSVDYTVIQ